MAEPAMYEVEPGRRFEVAIPDPDFPDEDWLDRLWAQWEPRRNIGPDHHWGGWWLICGDNTGSQNVVVHEYMLDHLIALLQALPRGLVPHDE